MRTHGKLVGIGLAVLLVAAGCGPAAPPTTSSGAGPEPDATAPLPAAAGDGETNACAYRTAEPTPVPVTRTPTPHPTATRASLVPTPPTAGVQVPPYPDLAGPGLPGAVKSWQEAIVRVTVEYQGGHSRDQQGLVVDASGMVLTGLDPFYSVQSIWVHVPRRGSFAADIAAFDPSTGAVLLAIDAHDLVAAPAKSTVVTPGEPALLLTRRADDTLEVSGTFASPSVNASEDLFALLVRYAPYQEPGTVVVTRDGILVGMANGARAWFGTFMVSGPAPGPDQPAVLLRSARKLLQGDPQNANVVPASVAYHGQSWAKFVDGPATRRLLARPVQEKLRNVGQAITVEGLGQRSGRSIAQKPGTVLELVYPTPQELRARDGRVLGSGRYIVFRWDRGEGQPDLVLCGSQPGYLGAAFQASGLGSLEQVMGGAPGSSRSIVIAAPLPGSAEKRDFSTYTYPYLWTLVPDKQAYLPGEPVRLTFTATNISQWPVPLDYLPPTVGFRNEIEQRRVAVAPFGNERRTLTPIETVSFTVTWDQRDAEGKQVGPGRYTAQAHVANVSPRSMGLPGPQTEIALMPEGGALQMTLTPQQTVTDAQTVVTLRSIEFTPGSTIITAYAAWTAPSLRETRGMPERAYARFIVDDGPAITAENRAYGDEEETRRRLVWWLPPVPADARKVTFVVTHVAGIEGRWDFSLDLGKQ